jgi:dihydroxyacetone kinase-like protein
MGRVTTDGVETVVDAATVTRWMRSCADVFVEQRDYLTQLDAAIGDADHGANMTRGFSAVGAKLDGLDGGTPPGRILVLAGSTLVSTVGGASGPLWGSAFRRAGKALGDQPTATGEELAGALDAAVAAVVELGAAERGDKTMVDSLAPAVDALHASLASGATLAGALGAARAAAEDGMRATVPMLARKGRASYLGERSIGHQDPGATSTALIIAALEQAVTRR